MRQVPEGFKAEAGNCGAAKRQQWRDKVKTKSFTMRPLTQRRNTGLVWADRIDRCHPGDWEVAASTVLVRDMKSQGRDGLSLLELPSNEGELDGKGKIIHRYRSPAGGSTKPRSGAAPGSAGCCRR